MGWEHPLTKGGGVFLALKKQSLLNLVGFGI